LISVVARAAFAQPLKVDYCRFRGEEGRVVLELYVDLPRSVITHRADSSGWFGAVEFGVKLSERGEQIADDSWWEEDYARDASEIGGAQHLIDARLYSILPGNYQVEVTASDSVSTSRWRASLDLELTAYPDSVTLFSDVQFASQLIPAGIMPQFDRDGYGLVPSSDRLFGLQRSHFFYYLEIYPAHLPDTLVDYSLERAVLDGTGDTVAVLPSRSFQDRKHNAFSDLDSVSVASLPTGSYSLTFALSDGIHPKRLLASRFFVYNSDTLAAKPEARPLDSAAVEAELRQVEFLLTNRTHKPTAKMTIAEKALLLDAFWHKYDDDPTTPEVPARAMFGVRVREADIRFPFSNQPGHKTDRGRIFSLFGAPDNRETHSLDISAKPYEIWHYDTLDGGVIFVFVDRNGLGEYILVHSNKRGELNHPAWYEDYVDRSGNEAGR
jgi:GWxTD domain-containing protein